MGNTLLPREVRASFEVSSNQTVSRKREVIGTVTITAKKRPNNTYRIEVGWSFKNGVLVEGIPQRLRLHVGKNNDSLVFYSSDQQRAKLRKWAEDRLPPKLRDVTFK